ADEHDVGVVPLVDRAIHVVVRDVRDHRRHHDLVRRGCFEGCASAGGPLPRDLRDDARARWRELTALAARLRQTGATPNAELAVLTIRAVDEVRAGGHRGEARPRSTDLRRKTAGLDTRSVGAAGLRGSAGDVAHSPLARLAVATAPV